MSEHVKAFRSELRALLDGLVGRLNRGEATAFRLAYTVEALGPVFPGLSTKRPKSAGFPCDTSTALFLLACLGYRATPQHLKYCMRHRLMDSPPKGETGRLEWTPENVLDFAMQLERLRYWLPGFHDQKKTCWEKDADLEAAAAGSDDVARWIEATTEDLLAEVVAEEDQTRRAAMVHAMHGSFNKRPAVHTADGYELLARIVAEDSKAVRRALADAILDLED